MDASVCIHCRSMTFMGEDIKGTWSKQYMDAWKNDYPFLAKYGFGLTVKCERWNGRHAMFGWAFIIATALCYVFSKSELERILF